MIDFTTLKNIYANSIDDLLSTNGLTVPCLLKYSDIGKDVVCPNCLFDPISRLSGNQYNNSGPIPFPNGSICPVCSGEGTILASSKSEIVNLAVIFDYKYFLNWPGKNITSIPDNMVQTICSISLIRKVITASSIIIDNTIASYGSYEYMRSGDPSPCGLGDHRYITALWSKKV